MPHKMILFSSWINKAQSYGQQAFMSALQQFIGERLNLIWIWDQVLKKLWLSLIRHRFNTTVVVVLQSQSYNFK